MTALAESRRVTMRFGSFTAVNSVDITVNGREVVGLLGANGAGKTTLIRLLLGLVRPSQGQVLLFDAAPSMATRRRLGYVPQTLGLYDDMTVRENWTLHRRRVRLRSARHCHRASAMRATTWSARCRSGCSDESLSPSPSRTSRSCSSSTSRRPGSGR